METCARGDSINERDVLCSARRTIIHLFKNDNLTDACLSFFHSFFTKRERHDLFSVASSPSAKNNWITLHSGWSQNGGFVIKSVGGRASKNQLKTQRLKHPKLKVWSPLNSFRDHEPMKNNIKWRINIAAGNGDSLI